MDIFQNLKLDKWYGVVLYLGILLSAAALFTQETFVERKHLLGLGLGAILLGVSYWAAEKDRSASKPANAYTGGAAILSWKEIRHSPITFLILLVGFGLVGVFGYLIIRSLI